MTLVAVLVDLPFYATTVPDILELELEPVEGLVSRRLARPP